MTAQSLARASWLLCVCILAMLPAQARGQSYSLAVGPSADVLTVNFPKKAPQPMVLRTGPKRVELLFPAGTSFKGAGAGSVGGRQVASIEAADNVLVVLTNTEAFGFVSSPKGDKAIQLQVFPDPAGARWKPAEGSQEAAQPKPAAQASESPKPQPQNLEPAKPAEPAAQPAPPKQPSNQVRGVILPEGGSSQAAPASQEIQRIQDAVKPQPVQSQPVLNQTEQAPQTAPKPATGGVVRQSLIQPVAPSQPEAAPAAPVPPQSQNAIKAPIQAQAPAEPDQPAPQQPQVPAAFKAPIQVQAPAEQAQPAPSEAKPASVAPKEVRVSLNMEKAVPMDAPAPSAQPAQPDAPAQAPAPAAGPDAPATQAQAAQGAASEPAAAEQAPPKPGEPKLKDSIEDKAAIVGAAQAMAHGNYEKGLGLARALLEKPDITKDLREEALYMQAEAVFALNKDKLAETYLETNDTIQQALNYNTTSWRLPRALIKLGYINLKRGNLPEARAYFNLLRTKYPLDEEVPLIDVYWGEHYLEMAKLGDTRANFTRAGQSFREVLQKYPESRFARDAALGLSKTQLELQQFTEASKVIDYIDKRWPRYYVENPSMRRVAADVAYKLGEFEKAKEDYLWFYNLVPGDAANDLVLARLGDVNMRLGKREAAREFYDMVIRIYPGSYGALMSMMRMAEQGVHDAPTMQEMFKAFADPSDIKPDKIYEIITEQYPKSPLAPLALLKLAMWRLYKNEIPEALQLVEKFRKTYPGDELEKQALDVGTQAFIKMLAGHVDAMNYKSIIDLWNRYPFLTSQADQMPDRERLGVALAMYYQGMPKEALALVAPYLDKGPSPEAQKALSLTLTIYRENQDWQSVLDTLRKVSAWKMTDNPRRALEFAQAMALEHTGEFAKSRLLWARLAADDQLDPAKRAYAVYYQARTAYERKDYDRALVWAMDSRTLFKESAKDDGKARDALQLMIESTQAAGRYPEALALCAEFAKEAPEGGTEWGANQLRIATLHRLSGNLENWRKTLEALRDGQRDSLAGRMAASELAGRGLQERAGKLTGTP
ncbi:tetratricopeptide repeat protein [Fundidesulfovibrio soli]|uniref:tetratricopeptide repeat protein n=1 Tax=Fundidesulfovibrio soli TaxID=2922716 RepID=UPI001FAFBF45